MRGIRTPRHLYVRNYAPHLPYGQHYSYAYNSRITPAWERAFRAGTCDEVQSIYWGARGCLIRWEKVGVAQKFLERVLDDENAAVRVTAAHALGKLGRTELALGVLGKEIQSDNDYEVLIALHALEDFPQDWKRFDARLREIAKKGKRGNASRVAAWMLKQMK